MPSRSLIHSVAYFCGHLNVGLFGFMTVAHSPFLSSCAIWHFGATTVLLVARFAGFLRWDRPLIVLVYCHAIVAKGIYAMVRVYNRNTSAP